MDITYGICVAPNYNKDYVNNLVESIENQRHDPSKHEVIFCGGNFNKDDLYVTPKDMTILEFDEKAKDRGWITKKKNDIVKAAKYDTIVLLHDYYELDHVWFTGMCYYDKKNPDWKIMMNTIFTQEGNRHSDWLVNQRYMDKVLEAYPHLGPNLMSLAPQENGPRWVCGLPYNVTDLTHIQYISGGFIIGKKNTLLEVPFNETLTWGDSEDIIWSQDLIQHGIKFDFNPYSTAFLQKPGKWQLAEMDEETLQCLQEMFGKAETRLTEIIKLRND